MGLNIVTPSVAEKKAARGVGASSIANVLTVHSVVSPFSSNVNLSSPKSPDGYFITMAARSLKTCSYHKVGGSRIEREVATVTKS